MLTLSCRDIACYSWQKCMWQKEKGERRQLLYVEFTNTKSTTQVQKQVRQLLLLVDLDFFSALLLVYLRSYLSTQVECRLLCAILHLGLA